MTILGRRAGVGLSARLHATGCGFRDIELLPKHPVIFSAHHLFFGKY